MNTTINTNESNKKLDKTESMMQSMIENFTFHLEHNNIQEDLDKKKVDFCIRALEFLKRKVPINNSQRTYYQEICKYTYYYHYLGNWHEKLQQQSPNLLPSATQIDEIFCDLIACLVEYKLFLMRENRNYIPRFDSKFAWKNAEFMSTEWKETILLDISDKYTFILNDLFFGGFSSKVINFYLGLPDYQALINHKETITSSEKTKQNLQEEVKKANDSIEKIDNLNNKLEELEKGYNFVGLSHGFENLLTEKKKSIYRSIGLLYVLGFLIILFPITKIFDVSIIHKSQENTLTSPHLIQVHNYTIDSNHSEQSNNINWTEILAGIALEFVLIYFFRVALNQYQITKTQIMQLELRRSLCQFIQSYAEYAQEIKEKDANALEKFENIIFSSILSHDANIPGTFDGMEHITSLIKELKGNK